MSGTEAKFREDLHYGTVCRQVTDFSEECRASSALGPLSAHIAKTAEKNILVKIAEKYPGRAVRRWRIVMVAFLDSEF